MLLILLVILAIAFYLLAQVSDEYFVPALERIAAKQKMTSDAAGATLMAFGSSAPELFVAIIALLKTGHADIGIGTIVGSALFNIFVIIGAAAFVKEATITWQPAVRDLAFYALSILILLVALIDGQIVLYEAIIFVVLYVVYVFAVIYWRKIFPYKDPAPINEVQEEEQEKEKGLWKKIVSPIDKILDLVFLSEKHYYLNFVLAIVIIAGISWILVESAISLAEILHIPSAIVALTVLAIGTSIPDMISSIIVAKDGRGDMAISNATGSNIFDILFGLGIPWLAVLLFTNNSLEFETGSLTDSIVLLFASILVIFVLFVIQKWRIGKKTGFFLIGVYLLYLSWEIIKLYI